MQYLSQPCIAVSHDSHTVSKPDFGGCGEYPIGMDRVKPSGSHHVAATIEKPFD
jgi:hypothetical protein